MHVCFVYSIFYFAGCRHCATCGLRGMNGTESLKSHPRCTPAGGHRSALAGVHHHSPSSTSGNEQQPKLLVLHRFGSNNNCFDPPIIIPDGAPTPPLRTIDSMWSLPRRRRACLRLAPAGSNHPSAGRPAVHPAGAIGEAGPGREQSTVTLRIHGPWRHGDRGRSSSPART
jgi:hypothetical protein